MEFDVVIVGAGIAGLSCALMIQKNKLTFAIVKSGDTPGGRMQTDVKDGFRLDHGFQLLQTGYPEAEKILDYRDLNCKNSRLAQLYDTMGISMLLPTFDIISYIFCQL